MAIAASLRDMTTQLPADQYTPNSLSLFHPAISRA